MQGLRSAVLLNDKPMERGEADARSRLRDPSHRASFESAHSLKLALIHAASDTLSTSPSNEVAGSIESSARKSMQARLMAESEEYCDILIKVSISQDLIYELLDPSL